MSREKWHPIDVLGSEPAGMSPERNTVEFGNGALGRTMAMLIRAPAMPLANNPRIHMAIFLKSGS
jgi:hypothetical protein